MDKINIKEVLSYNDLDFLTKSSALILVDVKYDKENINYILELINKYSIELEDDIIYLIKGKTINNLLNLNKNNYLHDDLDIISIICKKTNFFEFGQIKTISINDFLNKLKNINENNKYYDKNFEKKLKILSEEVKEKRDSSPSKSEEKQYYRKVSKYLDQILIKINRKDDYNEK